MGCLFQELLHGLVVILLDPQVGDLAVPLRSGDGAVSEQVLDGGQRRAGIEHLRGHRVPQMMTGCPDAGSFRIVLHSLLDAPDRERLASARSLLHEEDVLASARRSELEIGDQRLHGIRTDIHHSPLIAFAGVNQDTAPSEVDRRNGQLGDLGHAKPGAKDQSEQSPVTGLAHAVKKTLYFFILQVLRKRPGHAHARAFLDRIGKPEALFVSQEVVEPSNRVQMAIDGLGLLSALQQAIDVGRNLPFAHLLNWHVHPHQELFQVVQVVRYGVAGVISSLQVSPVTQDRVGNVHGCLLSQ